MNFSDLSGNQLRVAVESRQTYEAYREAHHNAAKYAGGMSWKVVGGHEYLIKCEFRPKLDSDSSRSWTVIPRQAGH